MSHDARPHGPKSREPRSREPRSHEPRSHDSHFETNWPSRKRFDDELLRRLRNEIPIDWLFSTWTGRTNDVMADSYSSVHAAASRSRRSTPRRISVVVFAARPTSIRSISPSPSAATISSKQSNSSCLSCDLNRTRQFHHPTQGPQTRSFLMRHHPKRVT